MIAESSQLVRLLAGGLVALVLGASACGQPSEVRRDETADFAIEELTPMSCDDRLDVDLYFAEYIGTESFRSLHPSFDRWQLVQEPDSFGDDTCLVDGQGLTATWSFELPAELSRYAIRYVYVVYLTITPGRSAHVARTERPEDLIAVAEAVPAVTEFFEKPERLTPDELDYRFWIATGSYGAGGTGVSPLQVRYWVDGGGWLTISGAGRVESATLDQSEQWETFPSLSIGTELVGDVLDGEPCRLAEPSFAALRAFGASGEPREVLQSYSVECEDIERGSNDPRLNLSVLMNPTSGEYVVWWPAYGPDPRQAAAGTMTKQQLEAIKRSPVLPEDWEATH